MATDLRPVNRTVWKACAGTSIQIPSVDSRVYYFPQGHAEHCSSAPTLSPLVSSHPAIYCRVTSVIYLANPETDEVFAKILLLPLDRSSDRNLTTSDAGDGGEDDSVASFAKVLTPSDANNGGGFSVPRFCADTIFPKLNFGDDPPVQNIILRDIHGTAWEFRHIYRGTPRRHLLTTGWSKFVNSKKLVAGDSVVFMSNKQRGELYVGVRRAVRFASERGGRWNSQEEGSGMKLGHLRSGKGRVSAESVVEAAEFAAQGREFELVYYPKAGWADFVVKAEIVQESLNIFWAAGMKVKMAVETEDSSRMTWFQGMVSSTTVSETGPWRGSPWRMLQVTWDEPDNGLQNMNRVSPWQVEYMAPASSLHPTYHPAKKLRAPQNTSSVMANREKETDVFFPMSGLHTPTSSKSTLGGAHLLMMTYNTTFPAGMQGARQEDFSSFGGFAANHGAAPPPISTDLNIGGSSQLSDSLSTDSQSSVHFFGSSTKESVTKSFQLFGKIIQVKEPPPTDDGGDGSGCTEDEGVLATVAAKVVSSDQLDLSLSYSCTNKKAVDRNVVQRQKSGYEVE